MTTAPRGTAASSIRSTARRRLRQALLLLWLLASTQASATDAVEEAETADAPSAIAVSEILSSRQGARAEFETHESILAGSEIVDDIAARIPEVRAVVATLSEREKLVLERTTLREVEDLTADWVAAREQTAGWRAKLRSRSESLERVITRLAEQRTVWQLTAEQAEASGAPEAVTSAARETLERIDALARRAADRRAELLTVQASATRLSEDIGASIDRLGELRSRLVRRVLERDLPPIWDPTVRAGAADGLEAQLTRAIVDEWDEARAFGARERDRLPIHVALVLLFFALLTRARRRVRARSEDETGLEQVAAVFEHPLSMALLLGLLVTPWLYGPIPRAVSQIVGAAALVPTVVILRQFTPRSLHPLLAALVAFYFADRVRELAVMLPLVSRTIFVVEMLAAAIFLALLLRPARLAEIPQWAARSLALRVLGPASVAALGAFCVAFVAELFGYSRLARLLGGGLLESTYFAVVVYTLVQVAGSLVTLALRLWPLSETRMVQRQRLTIRSRLIRFLRVVALATWAVVTLELFAIWRPLRESTVNVVAARFEVGTITISLGDLLAFAATVFVAFWLSRFIRFALEEDVYPRLRLGRGVPYAISTFLHYGILLLGFGLAMAAMGVDLDRLALLLGALGVGIGFGLQNVVNNFVSGLILLTERPIQVGDTIEAGDALGEVKRIGIRSSTVRTWTGAELVVPNGQLISERVTNWTLSDRQRRIDVPVGVAYGTDRARVLELLKKVADDCEEVIDDPPPVALFRGFGDSSLDFELRAWTSDLRGIAIIYSRIAMAIGDAIEEAGIEIPFPQRDLHVRSGLHPPAEDHEADGDPD